MISTLFLLGLGVVQVTTGHSKSRKDPGYSQPLPDRLDYRLWNDMEVISPVQDQGNVVSGWAFATTGAVEAQMAMTGEGVVRLSQQQLIDCAVPNAKAGDPVQGLDQRIALQYLREKGAIPAFLYPYTSLNTNTTGRCSYKKKDVVQKVSGLCSQKLPVTQEHLQKVLVRNGPQAVTVLADRGSSWSDAGSKKVIKCKGFGSRDHGNHAVLLVGYDTINGEDVWIIKNSWGSSWGLIGFGYLSRNSGADCGIRSYGIASPLLPNSALTNPICLSPTPRYKLEPGKYVYGKASNGKSKVLLRDVINAG